VTKRPSAFVERTFELDGKPIVHCRIFAPQPIGQDFGYKFEIEWPDRQKTYGPFFGIDGIQSFDLTLKALCSTLEATAEYKTGRLKYLGRRNLGLPKIRFRRAPPHT